MWRKSTTTNANADKGHVSGSDAVPASAPAASTGITHKWPLRKLFTTSSLPSQTTLARQYQLHKKEDTMESDTGGNEVGPPHVSDANSSSSAAAAAVGTNTLVHTLRTSGGDAQLDRAFASAPFAAAHAVVQPPGMDHIRQRHGGHASIRYPGPPISDFGSPAMTADDLDANEDNWREPVKPLPTPFPAPTTSPHVRVTRTRGAGDIVFASDDVALAPQRHHQVPASAMNSDTAASRPVATQLPKTSLIVVNPTGDAAPADLPGPSSAGLSAAPNMRGPTALHSGIRGLRAPHNSSSGASGEGSSFDCAKKKKKGLGAVTLLPSASPASPASTPTVLFSGSGKAAAPSTHEQHHHTNHTPLPPQRKPPEAERLRLEAEEAERLRLQAEEAERLRLEAEEVERLRLQAEEAERLRLEAEEAERLRLEAEEAERLRLEAEEAERLRLQAEEAERLLLEAEEAERLRLQAEEAERVHLENTGVDAAGIILGALCASSYEDMRGDFDFSPLVQSLRGAQQFFVGTDAVTVEGIAEPITCYREVLKSLLDHIRAHSTGATCTSAVMSPKVEKAVGTMCERWLNFSACLPSAWGWAWESAVHRPTSVAVAEAGPRRRRDSLSNLAIAVEEAGNRGAAGSPFWSPAQQVASALMVYLVQWSRQSAARRASCGDSAARSLAEAHSPAVIPPLPPRLAPPEDRPFDLVGVHACVLTALQEALSSRRNYSPAEADEEPAAWVQSLLECVALASLMRDEEVKSRALMSTFTCWGSTRHCGGRDTGSAEDAMRRVEQQLREGSWVLWYVLRVVGLMSWWDAVQPMLVPCGAPS